MKKTTCPNGETVITYQEDDTVTISYAQHISTVIRGCTGTVEGWLPHYDAYLVYVSSVNLTVLLRGKDLSINKD